MELRIGAREPAAFFHKLDMHSRLDIRGIELLLEDSSSWKKSRLCVRSSTP